MAQHTIVMTTYTMSCVYHAGGGFAHRSVPHLDTSSMHMVEDGPLLHPSSGRGSMSHKPPLSPYCPGANPLVSSFSASFSIFAADRVQSSPCIMQTDHAESCENTRLSREPMQEGEARVGLQAGLGECPDGMGAFLPEKSTCGPRASSSSLFAKPCDLVTHPHMRDVTASAVAGWHSDTQTAASLQLPGMTSLNAQANIHPSTSEEDALQQRASTWSDCQTLAQAGMGEAHATDQDILVDQHMMCCSSSNISAVEAAAEAASVSGLTATSSPCCTFQLPTALSQGIAASPAPSGDTSSSSEGSARRKSFSPLESGPVSILPLIENALIGLPSVSCSTLAQLIAGQHASPSVQVAIVDCRWVSMLTPHSLNTGRCEGVLCAQQTCKRCPQSRQPAQTLCSRVLDTCNLFYMANIMSCALGALPQHQLLDHPDPKEAAHFVFLFLTLVLWFQVPI